MHFDGLSVIDIAVEAIGFDLVPDIGEGISFKLSPPWLRLSKIEGLIPTGNQEDITVTFDAAGLWVGDYNADIVISSNDPDKPEVTIPAHLHVGSLEPTPEGPIAIDFNLAPGDQEQRTAGHAVPGETYDLQLNVKDAPDINGWSATIEYDPSQVHYVSGSFQASDFIPGLLALVDEKEDRVGVGGAVLGSDAQNAGDGTLSTLSFEVLDGFTDSTALAITHVSFRRLDGVEDKRTVRSMVTITSEPGASVLPGDFNGDEGVDFDDFFLFADAFGGIDPLYDLDGSGAVDFDDFFIFADYFGKEARAKLMALAREYINLPTFPRLEPNYPNPFNSSTTIRYWVEGKGLVELAIFDLTGQKVRTLVHDRRELGVYETVWNGIDEQGMWVSSGLYLARLRSGNETDVWKMTLLK